MKNEIIQLSEKDEVVIAMRNISFGSQIAKWQINVRSDIPRGHKLAIKNISKGSLVHKYGQVIGIASQEILKGDHVHNHNLTIEGISQREQACPAPPSHLVSDDLPTHFLGYARNNGLVGTRNYIALLSTVNCSATVCRKVADFFNQSDELKDYPNIDGVVAFTHGSGCAIDPNGEGYDVLQRTLIGAAFNPNVAAVVMVGLGCETNQVHLMCERYGLENDERLKTCTIQDSGGTLKTINKIKSYIKEMLDSINSERRVEFQVSELRLALQCGGSDAYSGITANPALGVASDILVALGGTSILSETPEIYGVEHILAKRAVQPEIKDKLYQCIEWWQSYTAKMNASMDNNPSFGNKKGGLSTIYEKSLGAVAKAGQSPLNDVYKFAEKVTSKGLVFVDTPGYDPVCSTGQIASGANIMCFTTGRGSVSGFKPVPTIKLATNTPMYNRLEDDMDINCGVILDGVKLEDLGRDIYRHIIDVASGKTTASERNGFGDNEFVPWQLGAIL